MIDVHQWAEIRRLHFSEGLGIKAIVKRTEIARNTVRAAIRSETPPAYRRPARPSKLDPFKGEIVSLLKDDDDIPGKRVLEILQGLGYSGGKSILNEHLAQVRPLFRKPRIYQRTLTCRAASRSGTCGSPRLRSRSATATRDGPTCSPACSATRRSAPAPWCSPSQLPICCGRWIGACAGSAGSPARTCSTGRERCAPTRPRDTPVRPSRLPASPATSGSGCTFDRGPTPRRPGADPEGKGVVERLHGYLETSFVRGRCFSDPEDFQAQLDRWFDETANVRLHSTIRCRPVDRLPEDRAAMLPLPQGSPDLTWRFHAPVRPDPYVRVDTNDYSVHPDAVGLVVEVRVTQHDVTCVTKDGRVVAHHARSFAPHRTITAAEHGRAIRELREGAASRSEPLVEIRDLASYDRLIGVETPELPGLLVKGVFENGSQSFPGPGLSAEATR